MTANENIDRSFQEEEALIQAVVARARAEGTIGVPQHPEPGSVMQFVEDWEYRYFNRRDSA